MSPDEATNIAEDAFVYGFPLVLMDVTREVMTAPGPGGESNWLPIDADAFNLVMRLYWPKSKIVNGIWKIPAVERSGGQ